MAHLDLALPSRHAAIVADDAGNLVLTNDAVPPPLEPDQLLLRTVAVAVNPSDVKMTGAMASPGCTAGGDCAGVVVAVGSQAPPARRFRAGDRVAAPCAFMDPRAPSSGAFAQHVAVAAGLALKIPEAMSFDAAAALGVAVATAGYALFRSLRVPGHPDRPASSKPPPVVLVHGGSTASGTMAIQLIRRAGLVPIATCSRHNFPLVERYGAERAFDYRDADAAVRAIKAYTRNALDYALDCVCDVASMQFCYAALGRAGGRYTTLEPFSPDVALTRSRRVKPDWLLGPALLGKEIAWRQPYRIEADPELRDWGEQWFACAQRLLDRGHIRPHPVRVHAAGGFAAVLDGIELLRQKAVSGEKLVYRIGGPSDDDDDDAAAAADKAAGRVLPLCQAT